MVDFVLVKICGSSICAPSHEKVPIFSGRSTQCRSVGLWLLVDLNGQMLALREMD